VFLNYLRTLPAVKFSVLNGFIEERGLERKNCVGVCTDSAACLTGRNSGLVTKIKDMAAVTYCQRIATFISKTWPPKNGT